MNAGPKLTAFITACGVAAAGLGVVSAGLPFLQKSAPAAVGQKKEESARACTDAEKELARAALNNYGRRVINACFTFAKDRDAALSRCEVDLVTRRMNARGAFNWRGGVLQDRHMFDAAFSTDLSGADIRVNVVAGGKKGDAACAALAKGQSR
jgi:hypothetical protein